MRARLMERAVRCALIVVAASTWMLLRAGGVNADTTLNTGDIRVYGNENVRTYVIRREILLRTGDPFDREEIERARRRIARIPGVDYSEIRVRYSPADSSLALDVVVTEKSVFTLLPTVRRGYEDELSFGFRMSEGNFRGRSETVEATVLVRANTVVAASWENPWLGSGTVAGGRIGLGVTGKYQNYRYVYDDLGGAFDGARIERSGGALSLLYTIGERRRWRTYATVGYEWVEGGVDGVTIDPGDDRFATVLVGARYDGLGATVYPWSGGSVRAEAAELGPGVEKYSIFTGLFDVRAFAPVFGRTVFGLHATARVKDGEQVPVYLREHIGGGLTLRGYEFGSFSGINSVVTGAEYRVPVNFSRETPLEDVLLGFSVHVFADAAAAWDSGWAPDSDDWHVGFGGGIQMLNSVTKGLRFDYGVHSGDDGRVHIEIGGKF